MDRFQKIVIIRLHFHTFSYALYFSYFPVVVAFVLFAENVSPDRHISQYILSKKTMTIMPGAELAFSVEINHLTGTSMVTISEGN